jgi:hypothetical protein
MPNYIQGYVGSYNTGTEARNDITVAIRNWFANRNPLVTRLPYVPTDRVDFVTYSHQYRALSTTLTTTAISSGTTTTITVADNSFLMNHDVLAWVDATTGIEEHVQVNGDPNSDGHTLTISRGFAGTAAATNIPVNAVIQVISNSRTGAEINQKGLSTQGIPFTQYCQTFQFPVQVGGSAQTTRAAVLPGGIESPFDYNMTMQLQNMVDSIERACYYGIGQANNASDSQTAAMSGLRSYIQTNNISALKGTTPANSAAYTSQDLIRDTLQACRLGGGEPDLLILGPDWMQALSTWGQGVQRVPAGETVYGTPIDVIEAPFLHGVTIIEAPLLKAGTAICLTSSEVYMRPKRNPFWQVRGAVGDMFQGDWIAEMAIALVNETHHAYVEGVAAFSN